MHGDNGDMYRFSHFLFVCTRGVWRRGELYAINVEDGGGSGLLEGRFKVVMRWRMSATTQFYV